MSFPNRFVKFLYVLRFLFLRSEISVAAVVIVAAPDEWFVFVIFPDVRPHFVDDNRLAAENAIGFFADYVLYALVKFRNVCLLLLHCWK
jgi:hypothetical protein